MQKAAVEAAAKFNKPQEAPPLFSNLGLFADATTYAHNHSAAKDYCKTWLLDAPQELANWRTTSAIAQSLLSFAKKYPSEAKAAGKAQLPIFQNCGLEETETISKALQPEKTVDISGVHGCKMFGKTSWMVGFLPNRPQIGPSATFGAELFLLAEGDVQVAAAPASAFDKVPADVKAADLLFASEPGALATGLKGEIVTFKANGGDAFYIPQGYLVGMMGINKALHIFARKDFILSDAEAVTNFELLLSRVGAELPPTSTLRLIGACLRDA